MYAKGFISILITSLFISATFFSQAKAKERVHLTCSNIEIVGDEDYNNVPPVAGNDTIIHFAGCDRTEIRGNLMANDYAPDGDPIALYFINAPREYTFLSGGDGRFTLKIPSDFTGLIEFEYYITEVNKNAYKARGEVFVYVYADHDCDNVADYEDLDNDNDGLLNIDEGNGAIDTDNDGITDDLDIDSDNDGITDNVEWQKENAFAHPSTVDENKNGWDDAYDTYAGGSYYALVDTDKDGIADYIDSDSDEDGKSDLMESKSLVLDDDSETILLGTDFDGDGLDDVFDVVPCWLDGGNVGGSNAVLKDSNKNGIRDWRDFLGTEEKLTFLTYPNPAANGFNIVLSGLAPYELFDIELYNISGQKLITKTIHRKNKIDVSKLENGIYIVKVMFDTYAECQQIVVNH